MLTLSSVVMIAFVAGASPDANAGSIYDFSFSGNGVSGGGTLLAEDNGDGTYTAVSGSGTVNGVALSLIANPDAPDYSISASGYFVYDNLLFPTQSPLLSSPGLLFSTLGGIYGGTEANIFSTGPSSYLYYENSGGYTPISFSLNPHAIPEPTSMAMLAIGILSLGKVYRRRRGTGLNKLKGSR